MLTRIPIIGVRILSTTSAMRVLEIPTSNIPSSAPITHAAGETIITNGLLMLVASAAYAMLSLHWATSVAHSLLTTEK